MSRLLTFILFISLTSSIFSHGKTGTYYIKGVAFGQDETVLKNAVLTVTIGNEKNKVTTNEKGEYEIKVFWAAACITKLRHFIHQSDSNPEFVIVRHDDKEIKINNRWKKYARKNNFKPHGGTKIKNLNFS